MAQGSTQLNINNISGTVSLPTGASTASKQDTGNTSLASIDGKITAVNTGAVVLAAGVAAIGKLTSNSGVTIGAVEIAAAQTIAVTNTGTFVTQATLAAETTKVIGVTRTADGAGNLLTTNSTTYTAKFGLDGNLLGTLGTAFSTAGKVDVKGADGDVFVRQTTGSNLHTILDANSGVDIGKLTANQSINISQVAGGTAINSGVTGALAMGGDIASAGADSGNPIKLGSLFSTTPATFTDGQRGNLQMGSRGSLWVTIIDKNTTQAVGFVADNSDTTATSSSGNKMYVMSRNTILNPAGTPAWDRQYGITNATNSTGTGIAAAGLVAQVDDTTPTTITENQFGNVRMAPTRALYSEPGPFSYTHIAAGQATTVIKASAGFLHAIVLNSAATAANVTTVYDNASGIGTVIAIPNTVAATVPTTLLFDCAFPTGLTIITATANSGDMTVIWR